MSLVRQALRGFSHALERRPQANYYRNRGMVHAELGDNTAAARDERRAQQLEG
jgi:hypothetical protein